MSIAGSSWSGACALVLLALPAVAVADEHAPPPVTARACTHHVALDGDDAGPGTAARPWRHVQHALDRVGPGAVVCVRPGTYREQVTFRRGGRSARRRLTLAAAPGATAPVVLDGTIVAPADNRCVCLPTVYVVDRSHVRISGLDIVNRGNPHYTSCTGARPGDCAAAGIGVVAATERTVVDDVVIDRCHVHQVRPAFAEALGIPVSVAASRPGAAVRRLALHANLLGDADTRSVVRAGDDEVIIDDGVVGMTGTVVDFLIAGNTFELGERAPAADAVDSVGVSLGGNQHDTAYHPARGVIRGNRFLGSGGAQDNYAINVVGSQRIAILDNEVRATGRGVGVVTEPPCGATPFTRAEKVWIRGNLFVDVRHADLVTGAFNNDGLASRCPGVPGRTYQDTADVWFTDNLLARPAATAAAAVTVVEDTIHGHGLRGDVRIERNLLVASDRLFDVTLEAPLGVAGQGDDNAPGPVVPLVPASLPAATWSLPERRSSVGPGWGHARDAFGVHTVPTR